MHRFFLRLALACLASTSFIAPSTHAAEKAPPATLSPEEARQAAAVLQDEHKRAEALRTLKAIAAGAPALATASSASAPTAPASASSAAAPAAAASAPLEANGLVARTLRRIGHWEDGLRDQVDQMRDVLADLPTLASQTTANLANGPYRTLVWQLALVLVVVFGVGLLIEWALYRALARPRNGLVHHADLADREAAQRAEREAHLRQAASVAAPADAAAAADGGTQPPPDDVALVRIQENGVERVEAVPVETGQGASGGPAAAAAPEPEPPRPTAPPACSPADHWSTLRHLPFALAALVLDVLPIIAFSIVSGLLLRWLPGDTRVDDITSGFVEGYVTARLGMSLLRLLVSPVGHGLRVLKVSRSTAAALLSWSRRILIVGTFGFALANAVHDLGAPDAQRLALIKVVSLVVHVCLTLLIFRLRRPVASVIAGPADATGPLVTVRHWLAQVWAFAAAVLVMGIWFVWALGVENGFPKLLHFAGVTAAVLVVARIIAVLVLGAIAHIFRPADPKDGSATSRAALARRVHAERYYPVARAVVTALLVVGSAIALLQVWGVDALSWFGRGTLGRGLASAAGTILVAIVIAVLVWELANAGVDRKLAKWNDAGDLMRAARLRTLLPMLRTCLFILIALVVGLTALSQIGVNTAPLLASASIVGVALGFGSQKLVQDFITGIFLLMENAMQVGDWVTVGGVSGSVEYLSIRTVRLRGGDGSLYTVPFSSVTTVNNVNRGIGNAAMRVSVVYETDVSRAIDELKAIGASLRADPAFSAVILNDIEIWGVDEVAGGLFTLAGQIRCTDKGRWGVQRELNRRILERFRQAGIQVTNPQTRVLLETPPVVPEAGARGA